MIVDLAVAEETKEPLDFLVANRAAQTIARRRPTPSTLSTGTSTVVSFATIRR
jgi:hypothetical protein